ncbi:hypothetical protein KNLIENLN_00011 [Sinorhizobium phage NV1.1.1]|nr:hypothetical protein KNLIENLN_00011 [Sinorhizobium phage NV1.1.1]
MSLNAKHVAALATLSRAFLTCKRAGLRIRGQGDSLTAWVDEFYENVEPGAKDGPNNVAVETYSVKHHGCYVDSGADDQLWGALTRAGRKALGEATP